MRDGVGSPGANIGRGIGERVPRKEDPMLVRGAGHYTDDLNLPGQAYAAMVRSRHAHGHISSIEISAAARMEGVLGVYVAADIEAAGFGPIRYKFPAHNRDGSAMRAPLRPG